MKRKYFTVPIIAALVGVGMAGAAKAHLNLRANDEGYTFLFNGENPNGYSKSAVENLSNWHYTEDPTTCSGATKACSITAPDADVDATGAEPILKASIDLQTNSSGSVYYVSDVEPLASYSNQD